MVWPIWIPVATGLSVGTPTSFSGMMSFLGPFLGFLIISYWLIGLLAGISIALWKRRWRNVGSLAAILICAGPLMAASMLAGDYVHFVLALPYYAIEVARSDDSSKPIYFHWPSAGLIPRYERNLVYDRSGEIAKVEGVMPSAAGGYVQISVRHFIGGFYLVEDFY